jgi:hypothetical protein
MKRPSMEKQRVAACDGLNRDIGGCWLAFRSAAKGVFINVYRHNGDFVSRWRSGGFPSVQRLRLPSSSACPPKTLHRQLVQSTYYPLQTSRNHSTQWFIQNQYLPQAMLAWTGDTYGPNGFDIYGQYENYGEHLAELFGLWMSEAPLAYCVSQATLANVSVIGDHPLDTNWIIFGDPELTRSL